MSTLRSEVVLIVRNDLRLQWRDLKGTFATKRLIVPLFFLGVLGLISVVLAVAHSKEALLGTEAVAWLFFAFLMLGSAVQVTLTVIFERGDIDLLLSSPISARAVLMARLISIAAGVILGTGVLMVPLIAAMSVVISPRYLWSYPVFLVLGVTAACGGIWLTLGFVRWMGVRRAKTWAQVVGAVLGTSVYLAFQLQNQMSAGGGVARSLGSVVENPVALSIAQAGRGNWMPLLLLAGANVLLVAVTARLLARLFVGGVQESLAVAPGKRRVASAFRFADGLGQATFRKDLRLTMRDPLLLSSVLPSVLYLLPLVLPLRRVGGVDTAFYLALGGYLVMVQLSIRLAEVAAAGEEGWDLIRISPAAQLPMCLGKIAAGMALPGGVCVALALVVAVMGRPGVALFMVLAAVTASSAGCWIAIAHARPTPRKDLIQRKGGWRNRKIDPTGIFVVLFFLGLGSGAVVSALKGYWIIAGVTYGILALFAIGCFATIRIKEIDWEKTG